MSTLPPYTPPPPVKEGRGVLFWVATGCGGCLVGLVIFVVAIYAIVVGAMKNSTPVAETLKRAQADPRVVAALGEPIKTGYLFTGKLNVNDSDGTADIRYPIVGPKGKATVSVVAAKNHGKWEYQEIMVAPQNGPPIDLLSK
jgi:hypothetical protein